MHNSPENISKYLSEWVGAKLKPAYLQIDNKLFLLSCGGNLNAFGISHADLEQENGLNSRRLITELLPFLEGVFPMAEKVVTLPAIEIAPDRYANVHIVSEESHYWILLLDVTNEAAQKELLQQKARSLDLLQNKNKQLIEKLELANKKLADALQEVQAKNQALQEIAEKRDEFFGIAMHDIRSPLTTFQMLVEAMEKGLMGELDNMQMDLIVRLDKKIQQQMKQVDELLETAQAEAGQIDLNRTPTDLTDLIREVLDERLPQAKEKEIEMTMAEANELPLIEIDKDKIRRLIDNLISNAIKYTEHGGKVSIAMDYLPAAQEINVSVKDTGVGIDSKDIENLFQKYHRAKNKPTDGEKSIGLGLYICKIIAEAHGGRIEVRSRVGQGSTFSFTLPC